jgi:hypothetical protein
MLKTLAELDAARNRYQNPGVAPLPNFAQSQQPSFDPSQMLAQNEGPAPVDMMQRAPEPIEVDAGQVPDYMRSAPEGPSRIASALLESDPTMGGRITPEMLASSAELRNAQSTFENQDRSTFPFEQFFDAAKRPERTKALNDAISKAEGAQAEVSNKVLEEKARDRKDAAKGVHDIARKMGVDPETATYLSDLTYADPTQIDNVLSNVMAAKGDDRTAEQKNMAFRMEQAKLPEIAAYLEQLGPKAKAKWIVDGSVPSGGMQFEVGADGTIRFSEGGDMSGMKGTTATMSGLQDKLLGAEDAIKEMNYISSMADPAYLTYKGKVKGQLGHIMDRIGQSDTEIAQFGADKKAFVNQVLDDVMKFRKMITGVAGGQVEMAKIEAMRANPNMGPAEFSRAIEEQIRSAQRDSNVVRQTIGMPTIEWPEYKFTWGAEESKGDSRKALNEKYGVKND